MKLNRYLRSMLGFLVVVSAMTSVVERVSAADKSLKPYRVIFNCDGHASAKDSGGDIKQWIDNVFGPLEGSHVDALFWCDGAGGNTANYDSAVLERTGARVNKRYPWIEKWIKQGDDPPKVVVREAKKRGLDVFYSFRINDIHDSFMPVEFPTFKVEHPEWMLGEKKYGSVTSYRSGLNFAVPEVRELKFRVIEEIFAKYDFDGLEIDFLRSAPYFLPGTEPANAHFLTELLRRVRGHLNRRGKQRGRRIPLAVRIDENLESCRLDGFDIKTWLDEGLIDILILGSGVIEIDVEAFKKLAAPKGVHVYPCLYGWPSKYSPIPAELAAGLALNYWDQGADGIYLFNWFPHAKNNSEAHGNWMTPLMQQIGDPHKLQAQRPKLMFAAERGRPSRSYPHSWMKALLPAELEPGKSLDVPIRVGVKLTEYNRSKDARVELRITIGSLSESDQLSISLNGRKLSDSKRNKSDIRVSIPPNRVSKGVNRVVLTLNAQTAKRPKFPEVTAIEIRAAR